MDESVNGKYAASALDCMLVTFPPSEDWTLRHDTSGGVVGWAVRGGGKGEVLLSAVPPPRVTEKLTRDSSDKGRGEQAERTLHGKSCL